MPGVVQQHVHNQESYSEGFNKTYDRLNERLGQDQATVERMTQSAYGYISTPSIIPSRYSQDEPFRQGAIDAVTEFAKEHNYQVVEHDGARRGQLDIIQVSHSDEEIEGEARAEREGLHIDQFYARYESPSADASEYTHNLFAEESEAFIEKQLRTVDRQFPDATEVEKLRITEDRLGVGHDASERIQAAYQEPKPEQLRESPRIKFG